MSAYTRKKADEYFDNHGVQTLEASAAFEAVIRSVIEDCAKLIENDARLRTQDIRREYAEWLRCLAL